MNRSLLGLMCVLAPSLAIAGGSSEPVKVEKLDISSSTDYELVVVPQPNSDAPGYRDPFMGNCKTFTVQGSYSWLHSFTFAPSVSRENHKAALAFLKSAQDRKEIVQFGWMGMGFSRIDEKNPCVVRSRALELIEDRGTKAVFSYHDAV